MVLWSPPTDIDVPEAGSVVTNPLNASTSLPSSPPGILPLLKSNSFVDLHPNPELSHSGPPEGGPVRLWKERQHGACGCVLISATALGRHPRLRCGVLFHVANRTLSFHGIVRDVVQFLLPLFQDGVLLSLSCLPFDRQVLELKLIAPQTSGAVPQRPSRFSSPNRPPIWRCCPTPSHHSAVSSK